MRILVSLVVVFVLFDGIKSVRNAVIKRRVSFVNPNFSKDYTPDLDLDYNSVINDSYGKLMGRIPSSGNNNKINSNNNKINSNNIINNSGLTKKNSNTTGGFNIGTKNNGCPSVVQIGCTNVDTTCIDGQFYINGEKFDNIKSTDSVEIIANDLKVNGEFIRHISPSGSNSASNRPVNVEKKQFGSNTSFVNVEGIPQNINMNYCNNVFPRMKDGKLFVNDIEVENYKPTDKVLLDHNNLYVNGEFIRRIEPKKNNGWPRV